MPPAASPLPAVAPREIVAAASDLNRASVSGPRLLARICDPSIDAAEVRALVEHDVHLTVRVLRIANSALYGRSRNISQVGQAVTMLGLDAIRSVVVASGFRNTFGSPHADGPIVQHDYLRHSLAVGLAAEQLARMRFPELASDAFVTGLLHDFGVQVQARLHLAGLQALRQALEAPECTDTLAAESALIGVGHETCALQALQAWSFPESIVTAAGWHHRPAQAPEAHRTLAHLIHLADALSGAIGAGFALELNRAPPDPQVLQQLGIAEGEVQPLMQSLPGRVAELEALLR